jgi:predicted  nucleic acid-binding Zn-ribbon protein
MSSHKDSIQDRLNRASEAKNVMLAKFKQAVDPNNPETIEKRRQRESLVAARAERTSQRRVARLEHEREIARQAALAAEVAAEAVRGAAEQAAQEAAEQAERQAALEAEQKAARDARYAARKAAKKQRRREY